MDDDRVAPSIRKMSRYARGSPVLRVDLQIIKVSRLVLNAALTVAFEKNQPRLQVPRDTQKDLCVLYLDIAQPRYEHLPQSVHLRIAPLRRAICPRAHLQSTQVAARPIGETRVARHTGVAVASRSGGMRGSNSRTFPSRNERPLRGRQQDASYSGRVVAQAELAR